MKLLYKINYSKKVKSYIYLFIVISFMNNLVAFGSEDKSVLLKINNENAFEKKYFENSIPYNVYDNTESQLKLFFGRWRDPNRNANIFYPDFPIPKNSDSLREIYKSKLNDMTINDIQYNDYE